MQQNNGINAAAKADSNTAFVVQTACLQRRGHLPEQRVFHDRLRMRGHMESVPLSGLPLP
jgi:hypothetical protein